MTDMISKIFRSNVRLRTIRTIDDLAACVQEVGFLPFLRSPVKNFSVYSACENFWTDDGPWEWKGAMIRDGRAAYGKFFNKLAGYVSMDWLPDFINYRRSLRYAHDDDTAALDDIVLQTIHAEGGVNTRQLKAMLGLSRGKKDNYSSSSMPKITLEPVLTRLMMSTRIVTADFIYDIDRNGRQYGWGIACYATPERLYGSVQATCSPEESLARMMNHISKLLPKATEAQLRKII